MFEDGIYVSYFSDDEIMGKNLESVVVIENAKVNIMLNPKISDATGRYLTQVGERLAKESLKDDYENMAVMYLGKFWEGNAYSPSLNQFFETDSDEASKVLQIARAWEAK